MSFDPTLDRREAILERLIAIGQGLNNLGRNADGSPSVWRNHGLTETGVLGVPRPAYLLYDGGTKLTQDVRQHKIAKMMPTIWCMEPQVVILLRNRDTVENMMLEGQPDPVGPALSQWMMLLNNVITNDDQLIDLVTANGTIALSVVETDLKLGQTVGAVGAWLMMVYQFYYPLFPPR